MHRRLRRPPGPQRQSLGQGDRRAGRLSPSCATCAATRRSGRRVASSPKKFAARWVKEADDGDHYRLAFDRQGTWSQKYNLVWDKILGLGLFPPRSLRKEMEFYLKTQKKYGLPLDNRKPYTKLDWTLWTATLTGDQARLRRAVAPVYHFLERTPDRVPMTDWYMIDNGKQSGFQARPVVGGVFIRML